MVTFGSFVLSAVGFMLLAFFGFALFRVAGFLLRPGRNNASKETPTPSKSALKLVLERRAQREKEEELSRIFQELQSRLSVVCHPPGSFHVRSENTTFVDPSMGIRVLRFIEGSPDLYTAIRELLARNVEVRLHSRDDCPAKRPVNVEAGFIQTDLVSINCLAGDEEIRKFLLGTSA